MIKLDLKQNAFHTLRHAIQHLAWASEDRESWQTRKWNSEGDCVQWKQDGHDVFQSVGPLGRRPARYNLKFALLHLIQSCELLLKAHLVASHGPSFILQGKTGEKTISIHKALTLTGSGITDLLTPPEFELLCRANDLRNQIQHHELAFRADALRQICIDFLAVCCFLSQKLFSINVASELTYDPVADGPDPLGEYLSDIASELSPESRRTTGKIASDWLARNQSERTLLCIMCGSRTLLPDTGFCAACGAEGDEHVSLMVEELDKMTERIGERRRSPTA